MTSLKTAPVKWFALAAATLGITSHVAAVEYQSPFTWSVVYDASVLPGDTNALQYIGTNGAFGEVNAHNLNAELRDGVLAINSVDGGRFTISANQPGLLVLDSDNGYTAEFRTRLIRTVNTITPAAPMNLNASILQLNDGRPGVMSTVHLGLFTHPGNGLNYAQIRAGAFSPAIEIGTEFQIFTFVVTSGGVSVYVNGYHLANLPPWVVVERPEVWIGDITGPTHIGHFEIDYLKVYDGGAVHPVDIGSYQAPPISAWPEPRPQIVGFDQDNEDFLLSFQSMIGGKYVIESRDGVTATPNTPLTRVAGVGGAMTARESMTNSSQRYYRVGREPEEIVYEQSFDWDFRYEGDADPLSSDAIQYKNGTTGSFVPFRSPMGKYDTNDGVLMWEFPLSQSEGGAFDVSSADPERFVVNPTTGYTVEYRARVNRSLHYGAAILEINSGSGFHLAQIGLVTAVAGGELVNYVRLQSAAGNIVTAHPVGEGYNTFTLLGEENKLTLFINGVEVTSTTNINKTLDRSFLRFGHVTSAANTSRYDVDYIRVYTGGAVRPVSPLAP